MRSSPTNLLRAALMLAAVGGAARVEPAGLHPSVMKVAVTQHRRAGNGPGTKAYQRMAKKARNVQRNRKAHRG